MLFVNGKIWQWNVRSDGERVWAEWMALDDKGNIEAIGSGPHPDSHGPTQLVDLNRALVLPGLHDSHIHAYYMGESAKFLNLTGCASFDEFSDRLRKCDEQFPEKSWIIGFGWEQDKLSPSARYPSRHDIDTVVRGRPVLLHRACWHIVVVNTKALEVAGVDIASTSHELASGTVDVDEYGATGILREAAVDLVTKHINEKSDEIRRQHLERALADCVRCGLTAIHTNDHDAWNLYSMIQKERGLPLRVYLTPLIDELCDNADFIAKPRANSGLLSCDRIKIFSDGSVGAETAALRLPYRGTTNTGILMETNETLLNKVQNAHNAGYRLEIHAIGDRAAEQVLLTLEKAGVPREKRPILTHCQILGDDLITKMNLQGVIGNVQPSFTITDASFARKRLPEEVIPFSYCWKTMMQRGVVCVGGSDAPIETCNPFQGIYDAMYRAKPNQPESVYLPIECLAFEEALEMYTKNGAFAAMEEHRLGQLAVGYKADLVVLREDIYSTPERMLQTDIVQSVWVDGKKTFEFDSKQAAATAADFSQSSLPGKNG